MVEVKGVKHTGLILEMIGEEQAVAEGKMKKEVAMVVEIDYCYLPFHFFLLICLVYFVW